MIHSITLVQYIFYDIFAVIYFEKGYSQRDFKKSRLDREL